MQEETSPIFRQAVVPSRAGYYQAKATACLQKAKRSREPQIKAAYKDLAHQWREMAQKSRKERLVK